MLIRKIPVKRGALYATLGSIVATGAAAPLLSGCRDEPDWNASSEAYTTKGVAVVVRETDNGFVIDDEKVVDGPSKTVILYKDGRAETIADPDSFATRLPATPPAQVAPTYHGGGFGLGDVLLMSMLMNVWRPPYYSNYHYAPPPSAYANRALYDERGRNSAVLTAYQRRGLAPTGLTEARRMQAEAARVRTAPRARTAAPSSSGRSGFGRSASPSGG